MKKVKVFFYLNLIFSIVYFLQLNFFSWFNLNGIKPNMLIIFVMCIGLYTNKNIGGLLGIFFGFILDIYLGKSIGICAIMLGIIGFIGGVLENSFSNNSRLIMISISILGTFIYEIGLCIFNYFINDAQIVIYYFIKNIIVEAIFNGILVIIVYSLIIKFKDMLNRNLKEDKLSSQYF